MSKISLLPELVNADGSELVPVVKDGVTRRARLDYLATAAGANAAASAALNVALMTTAPRIARSMNDLHFPELPSIVKSFLDRMKVKGTIYDPSNSAMMWKNVEGTQPAVVGDTVYRMDDLSGQGRYLRALGSSPIGVLRQDENGSIYLDTTGTYATHAYWAGRTSFGSSTYVGVALAQMQRGGAEALFTLAENGARGIFFTSLNNGSRIIARFVDQQANIEASISTPQGAAPQGVPVVVDVQLTPGLMSSWLNGSGRSIPTLQYDGGIRVVKTATASDYQRTGVAIGLNWRGDSPTSMAHRFYGSVWIDTAIDAALRRAINSWLLWRTGQLSLDALIYDLYVVLGQSNAQGVGDVAASPVPLLGQGSYWSEHNYIAPMADPVRQLAANVALSGSAWPRFTQRYYQRARNPAMIIGAAASGCAIFNAGPDGAWGPQGGLVEKAVAKVQEAYGAIGSQLRMKGLVYMGGENDREALQAGSVSIPDYAAAIVGIRNRMRTQLGMPQVPMFIISTDRSPVANTDLGFDRLRQAQLLAGQADSGMKLAVQYQDYAGQGMLVDSVHLNQAAQNNNGLLLGDAIADYYGYPLAA